ncbi:hypothetical protein BGW38_006149, partial [Lunasporangiospora selenospora]
MVESKKYVLPYKMPLFDKKDEANGNPKIAVMFIGNKGVGKSALLSQLGGHFASGFSFVEPVTTTVTEELVTIEGKQLILMDVPGLYEVDSGETEINSGKLTEALSRGYHYKLFFVVSGNSRTLSADDLALMARVNEAVRKVDGAEVEYRVIVNQIRGEREYQGYLECMTRDNLHVYLSKLKEKTESFSFDIRIKHILLLRYDEWAIDNSGFYQQLALQVMSQKAVTVTVKRIITDSNDVKNIKRATSNLAIGAALIGITAFGAIVIGAAVTIASNPAAAPRVVKIATAAGAIVLQ